MQISKYKADFYGRLFAAILPVLVFFAMIQFFLDSLEKIGFSASLIMVSFTAGFVYVCWLGGSRLLFKGGRIVLFSRPNDKQFLQRLRGIKSCFNKGLCERLVFVSGEAPSAIYSRYALEVMRKGTEAIRNNRIGIIAGPVILLDPHNPKCLPPLFTMVDEGFADLYISRTRQKRHFMVSSSGFVRWEKLHQSCASFRFAIIHEWKIDNKSDEALELFDNIVSTEHLEQFKSSSDLGNSATVKFICMERSVLKKMVRDIEPTFTRMLRFGTKKFNDLTVQEIIAFANKNDYTYYLPSQLDRCEW